MIKIPLGLYNIKIKFQLNTLSTNDTKHLVCYFIERARLSNIKASTFICFI